MQVEPDITYSKIVNRVPDRKHEVASFDIRPVLVGGLDYFVLGIGAQFTSQSMQ